MPLEKTAHQFAAAEDKHVLAGLILEPGDFFSQVAAEHPNVQRGPAAQPALDA